MRENYKITWSLILLNAAFALLQAGFTWGHISQGRWMAVASILCMFLNGWAAWYMWQGMRLRQKKERDRVVGYLSGKIG